MHRNNFILLAEDDEDDQELIRMAFEKVTAEHNLVVVNNGQEAINMLSYRPNLPCLIILDLNMPVLNGIQTLKVLSEDAKYQNVAKVVLTTSDSDDNKKLSYSNGAADYFVKPFTLPELVATAKKILLYCR
jgi:DNA-binding response OmpR family regulator